MSDQFQDQYNQVQNLAPVSGLRLLALPTTHANTPQQEEHRAKLTHELAAGAVSYEAAKK